MSRWQIELPGPFAVMPTWPTFGRSLGIIGFVFITLPWWMILLSLALMWAAVWLAIWTITILVRLLTGAFKTTDDDEPIDEPAAYDNHLTHRRDRDNPNEWSDRR